MTVILGVDAGVANMGATAVKFSKKSFEILEICQVLTTFRNLTEETIYKRPTKAQKNAAAKKGLKLTRADMPSFPPFSVDYPKFFTAMDGLITDHSIDHLIVERFQTRGHGGPLIEMVGIQLGTISALSIQRKFNVRLVIASQWKNKLNQISNLEDMYSYAKQFGYTPHECDSTGMALYQADYLGILPLNISLPMWPKAISKYYERQN